MENNLNWTGEQNVLEFLRDVGKHFSVNVMLNRETVKRRLESDGMSYTEFSYLLLQSQDYQQLHRKYGCKLQVGGSDQWGNLVGGVDLIRRTEGAGVHALTAPLVTDAEGRKFGKSTGGGNLWLDPEMTSPYAWYQYFVNVGDADVIRYLRMFTFLGQEEIAALAEDTEQRPHLRAAQKRLAEEFTTLVHGEDADPPGDQRQPGAVRPRRAGATSTRRTLDAAMAEVPNGKVDPSGEPTIVDLLLAGGLVDSKGAARRTVKEGGAYVNNVKIADEEWKPGRRRRAARQVAGGPPGPAQRRRCRARRLDRRDGPKQGLDLRERG